MPSVTHDARSFSIDGRRIWLIGARVPYARLPRDAWADRIHAAKLAGFNLIETPVFWNRHEPRPGRLDFTGDNDLRYFIDLVGKAGMLCSLGIGPYVNAGNDLGGLPPWLVDATSGRLRTTGGAFLESTSRFITALADQIRGWQVTAAGSGGPIVMLQVENQWTCADEELGSTYLGEINRYLRESGLTVPLINNNMMWASVEGQIDGWSDSENSLEQIRQLSVVRPEKPRFVVDLLGYRPDTWGRPAAQPVSARAAIRRAVEVLAAGGQFTVQSFCSGVNFGFSGGRTGQDPASFVTAATDAQALVGDSGQPQNAYYAVRRAAMFASRFGRVFANFDPQYRPVSLAPQHESAAEVSDGKKARVSDAPRGGCAVIHCVGSQGGVVFLLGDEPPQSGKLQSVNLMLGDGWTLPVTLPREGVAWCLFDVNVSGRSRVDYCNVSALGFVGQTLVCFGPAGSKAQISVNGAPIEIDIVADKPSIIDHEGLTLVVVAQDETDRIFFKDDAVAIGVAGLTLDGSVIPVPGSKNYLLVQQDGERRTVPVETSRTKGEKQVTPSLGTWTHASLEEYASGESARFATIPEPADLTKLGVPYGYGWYRISMEASSAKKLKVLFPYSRDRLQVFCDGKAAGVAGVGPGAVTEVPVSVRKGRQSLVVLADNMGRFCEGSNLGEPKGLYGHAYAVAPVKVPTPKLVMGKPIEALSFRSPLWEVRDGDSTLPERLTWSIQHKRKTPLIILFPKPIASGLVILNDSPLAYMDPSGPTTFIVEGDQIDRGTLQVQVALLNSSDPTAEFEELAASSIQIWEGVETITEESELSFAKWEAPSASSFGAAPKKAEGPCWWKSTFAADKGTNGLAIELAGMTKGQIYLNGRHLCRYWVATPDGKPVPPQSRYVIPGAWLTGGSNEVMLFDEHGASPSKVRLVHQ
jgi:beta-galactosidase